MVARGSVFRPEKLPLNLSNVQFARSVLLTFPKIKLKQAIGQLEKKLLSFWHQVESIPFDALKLLLSALARVPFSASIALPPLDVIRKAVTVLLSQLTQAESNALDGNDDTSEGWNLWNEFSRDY
ncbi:hypothetical protein PsorP6_017234 [Peronosclerospora sorghi]|uniref:Uncharacterized protein n=1 Tax=Peronosclerospora sorghi TaxID=230839 RepID=A0ACC0WMK9_9STRA|nr:hypothetical protein PsorP6_017234 [Peronosclerospora sorghi]